MILVLSCPADVLSAPKAVERTFLAYLRTSIMLANIGALIAQLFALRQTDAGFGYSRVAEPLSTACFACALVTIIVGATRAWRHQNALVHGKALAGGFELATVGLGYLAVCCNNKPYSRSTPFRGLRGVPHGLDTRLG